MLFLLFLSPITALQLFTALCRQEVQEVIRLCTNSSYTSLQFVTHSFEVLKGLPAAAGVITRPLAHMGCDQAENFTLNYVEVLAGSRSTWLLGAEYLAWCPVYGADALESLLDRSPVSGAAVASLLMEVRDACWLSGWLVGWLAGWLYGWLWLCRMFVWLRQLRTAMPKHPSRAAAWRLNIGNTVCDLLLPVPLRVLPAAAVPTVRPAVSTQGLGSRKAP